MRSPYPALCGDAPASGRIYAAKEDDTALTTPAEIRSARQDAAQTNRNDWGEALDTELTNIIAMQRAISRETEFSRLVEALLIVAVEHTGAERGLLFLTRGREPEIEAEAISHCGILRVVFPSASAASVGFPKAILRYVLRMEESIVLADASADNQFSDDDYIGKGTVRSILCIPLITQRDLVGVLYLENILAPHALAHHRLAALEMLTTHAAISFKSARLRVDLQHENNRRRKAEEGLERITRMYGEAHLDARAELMGGVTAALAHELNQPLETIDINAQTARRLLSAPKPDLLNAKAAVEGVIRNNSQVVDIVRNLTTTFQGHAAQTASVDLEEILHDVERIVTQDAAHKEIAVRFDLPVSLPLVVGNRTQLVQVLMNLIQNALEAICDNEDHEGMREVVISARQREPRRVHVAVRDSGKGIDSEILPRMFEPLFTTKTNGMGMGLTIARSIVENYDGRVWATRNSDCGATMEFDLPVKQ
jgi:signal transduction histidine kinase